MKCLFFSFALFLALFGAKADVRTLRGSADRRSLLEIESGDELANTPPPAGTPPQPGAHSSNTGCDRYYRLMGTYMLWHINGSDLWVVNRGDASASGVVGIKRMALYSRPLDTRGERFSIYQHLHTGQFIITAYNSERRILIKKTPDSAGMYVVQFGNPDFDPNVWQDTFKIRVDTGHIYSRVNPIFFTSTIIAADGTVKDVALELFGSSLRARTMGTTSSGWMHMVLVSNPINTNDFRVHNTMMIESYKANQWLCVNNNSEDRMGWKGKEFAYNQVFYEGHNLRTGAKNNGLSAEFYLWNPHTKEKVKNQKESVRNWRDADLLKDNGSGGDSMFFFKSAPDGTNTWWRWERCCTNKNIWTDHKNDIGWVIWTDGSNWDDYSKYQVYALEYDPRSKLSTIWPSWT